MQSLRAIALLVGSATITVISGSATHTANGARTTPRALDAAATWTPITAQQLTHGRFRNFTVYDPHATPKGFVLLLSSADGWSQSMTEVANRLAQQGAMVAGIDVAQFGAALEADDAECVFPDGDLENLSHFVQAYYHLPTYLSPIVAGYSAGATLAYATLAQAPANTFAGAVSMEFCPSYALRKPLCKGEGLSFRPHAGVSGVDFLPAKQLKNPWVVVQSSGLSELRSLRPPRCDTDAVRDFVAQVPKAQLIVVPDAKPHVSALADWPAPYAAAFDGLMAQNAPLQAAAPDALTNLPLVVIAAQPGAAPSDIFAIMLSGDGGWAGLDTEVARALSAKGIPVIGIDSLRYFWSPRTAAGLAADLDRIIQYYVSQLGKQRVILIGYSQGADVLPFAVNRLTEATRSHVALAAVMGMSDHALFEFHLTSWIRDDNSGPATMPEVHRISGMALLCIYGEEESDSLCPQLDPRKVTIVKLKGGHHFDGNYDGLARTILASATARRTSPNE